MASQKLDQLTALPSAVTTGDKVYVVRDSTDYQADADDLPGAGLDGRVTALENAAQPTPTGNQLIGGGGVAFIADLTINVSAATYTIQGTQYTSPETELEADEADATNPRIDVVAVNSSGAAVLIKGTAAATPVKPDVDPTTQLELTFFVVQAGATALDTNVVDVYRENAEYTMTENGTSITLDSTNNPHGGTKTIEATSAGAGDYFQAQTASGTIDLGDYDSLVFFIRNKAAWASAKQINITARSSGTQVGSSITFKHGLFGFDQTNTTTYQQIVIPASLFAANGQSVNQLRWAVAGGGGAIGFYVDDISLQGGLAPLVDATRLKLRTGDWDQTLLYQANDVTKRSGIPYAALRPNINKDPATQTADWQPLIDKSTDGTFASNSDALIPTQKAVKTYVDANAGGGGSLTLARWTALDGQPPSSNYATFDTRNAIAVLDFDDATAESIVFVGIVPEGADFTTGITVRIVTLATSATSGNMVWTSAFERGNTDLDSDSFATGVDSAATATNGTSGIPTVVSINHSGSELDGIAAGDLFRLKITRKVADDTMAGDAEVIAVEIQQR